jgi:hypothetical protein
MRPALAKTTAEHRLREIETSAGIDARRRPQSDAAVRVQRDELPRFSRSLPAVMRTVRVLSCDSEPLWPEARCDRVGQ